MKIFVISLKNSTDRRNIIRNELSDIEYDFFDAELVKGNDNHFIYEYYSKQKSIKFKGYELTPPELGCFASHISLWKRCINDNTPYLILEDNGALQVKLSQHTGHLLNLVTQYGYIKLDRRINRKFQVVTKIDDNYRLITNEKGACGTSGYIIAPHVAKLFLQKSHGFFEPIDDFIDSEWRTKQTVYCYYPSLICRNNSKSTIGKRKDKTGIKLINRLTVECYRVYKQIRQKLYNIFYKKQFTS